MERHLFFWIVALFKKINRLKQFYTNKGYFDTKVFSKNSLGIDRKAEVKYFIEPGKQYTIDSITKKINSSALDSLYESSLTESLIQKGYPFEIDRFEAERSRLINLFRNKGVYNFQQNSIQFTAAIDSSGADTKIPVIIEINDLQKKRK